MKLDESVRRCTKVYEGELRWMKVDEGELRCILGV